MSGDRCIGPALPLRLHQTIPPRNRAILDPALSPCPRNFLRPLHVHFHMLQALFWALSHFHSHPITRPTYGSRQPHFLPRCLPTEWGRVHTSTTRSRHQNFRSAGFPLSTKYTCVGQCYEIKCTCTQVICPLTQLPPIIESIRGAPRVNFLRPAKRNGRLEGIGVSVTRCAAFVVKKSISLYKVICSK